MLGIFLSLVFSSLFLAMFGMKKSKLYYWNNRIACWGFFLVRIAVIPFAWYKFYLQRNGSRIFLITVKIPAAWLFLELENQQRNVHVHGKCLHLYCHNHHVDLVRLAKSQLVLANVRQLLQIPSNKQKRKLIHQKPPSSILRGSMYPQVHRLNLTLSIFV